MWTVLLDPIVGINVGIEYVGDEKNSDGYTIIVDLFFFRIVVIKE